MEVIGFLAPWVLIGIGVIFIAFSGGPGAAREAYLTGGHRTFKVFIPLLYIAFAIAVPALVIAKQQDSTGGTSKLVSKKLSDQTPSVKRGKQLFAESCAACHTLRAINARGIAGPNLDKIGTVTPARVLNAIRVGGTGQQRMPSGLLQGRDAKAVADYVSTTAGK
jgi:mono/diheme cytochrome c family protein